MYVLNAISLNMLPTSHDGRLEVMAYTMAELQSSVLGKNLVSGIGHADTAAIFSRELGVELPMNRLNFQFVPGEYVVVGQYIGPRLAEGARSLPIGARIEWFLVRWLELSTAEVAKEAFKRGFVAGEQSSPADGSALAELYAQQFLS